MNLNRERDRRGAAYHEAGHAVVAWALGLQIGEIEIAIGGDDAKGNAEIENDEGLPLIDRLAICVAGMEAQDLFSAPTA
jgi:ATP-dependent Zn protease